MSQSFISIWSGFNIHTMVQNDGDFHCSYDYKVHDCFFFDLYPGELSNYPITTASKSKKQNKTLYSVSNQTAHSDLSPLHVNKAFCSTQLLLTG